MDRVLVCFCALTFLAYLALAVFRPASAAHGLHLTVDMFLQSAPWIIVSLFATGLLAQLLNPDWIASLLGRQSGLRGIVIGAMLGMLGTGTRWAVYPIAAGLFGAEASAGSVFAFVTTWQLVSLPRLPAEVPFFGERFTVIRAAVSFIVAVIGGLIIQWFED